MKDANPWDELRDEYRTFTATVKPRKPRRQLLRGFTYCHATIFSDLYCGERADAEAEALDLLRRAFGELGARVGVPAPPPARTSKAWKATRAAYLEMQRAARAVCQAEGLKDTPHESDVQKLDPHTHAGIVARLAAGLGGLLQSFWYADEYGVPVNHVEPSSMVDHYAERISNLRRWLQQAARCERYGAEAVRWAKGERARRLTEALAQARASVPTVEDLLRERPPLDPDAALDAELGDEWRRFLDERGAGQ